MPSSILPPAEAATSEKLGERPLCGSREDAHDGCALEWWFFHGRYRSTTAGERGFMVALFRYGGPDPAGDREHGHQLLLAVFDPGTAAHDAGTWIDGPSVRMAVEKLKGAGPALSPILRKALLDELEGHGPPLPVVLRPEPIDFHPSPLCVEWAGFLLRPAEDGIELHFCEPGPDGAMVDLRLAPLCRPVEIDFMDGMAYRSYPRLALTGTRLGEELAGEGWMDHQWGSTGWMVDSSDEVLFGWDWFGINLDDGSDWIVMRHRDARSGEVVASHAAVRERGGALRPSTGAVLRAIRHWESPRTRIEYPVAWEIEIPDLGASFTFQPMADDQELAVLGSPRAVWEGAGLVSGSVGGLPVSGRARGEFHGYGYVFDAGKVLQLLSRRVERRIEEFLPRRFGPAEVQRFVGAAAWRHEPEAFTETIARPVWDLLDRDKKCWRPIFGLLLIEAFGVPSEPYEGLVSVMTELIHTAALIVDDIEDGSCLRRGEECIHLRYGVDVAVNAANLLFFLPGIALMEHPALPEAKRARLHQLKERVCIEAHFGQATDIFWSRHLSPEKLDGWLADGLDQKILQMYAFKTGAATVWLAESAALIADQPPETLAAAIGFARRFAVAFQVVDDIHDFSRSAKWTKRPGEDLANGKLTYVIATALRLLDPVPSARLAEILCYPGLRCDPAIRDEGIELVRNSGALAACREWAGREMEESWASFEGRLVPSESKILLHALCLKLLDLAFDT